MKINLVLVKKSREMIMGATLFVLSSCTSQPNSCMHPHVNRFFNIAYTKDTIIIDVVDNGRVISDKYYCKKGEYYDYKDSNLYFSTKREMEFKYSIGAAEYSIQIKKEGENYKTSVYLISPELGAVFLSAFFYDKQYRIYKIERSQTVEFY